MAQPVVVLGGKIQKPPLGELIGLVSKAAATRGVLFQERIVHYVPQTQLTL